MLSLAIKTQRNSHYQGIDRTVHIVYQLLERIKEKRIQATAN